MARDPHINASKKREGRYEKMLVPFADHGVLEICMNDKWYRTTTKFFRSFSGPRRITMPERIAHGLEQLDIPFATKEYNGPVFAMDTNYEYIGEVINDFITREMLND